MSSPPAGPGASQQDRSPRLPGAPAGASRTPQGRIRIGRGTRPDGLTPIPITQLLGTDAAGESSLHGSRGGHPGEETSSATSSQSLAAPRVLPSDSGLADAPVRCHCGRESPPQSRFCRCGQMLVPAQSDLRPDDPRPAAAPVPSRGLGSSLERAGERRRFDREMRRAATGRSGYSRPLALRVVAFRTTLVVALIAVVLASASTTTRSWAADRLSTVLPGSYREIDEFASVRVDPEMDERPGYLAQRAVDGSRNRAWMTAWDPTAEIGESCPKTAGRSATLVLRFTSAVRVDRVSIRAGLPKNDPEAPVQAQPKQIGIQLDDQCWTKDLSDSGEPQVLKGVAGRDVRIARVWIVDTFDHSNGSGTFVAISEIDFSTGG
ncbi:hypothetical protein CcI49_26725 [Frankia sp. CcI49]|uniref:zinc ribbon domain-containing protein n=1 Tax=unclassified Frankia TaxID=2632575 RepID=UPI0006CA3967|nr:MULTISPECIES: zinc ribbon domain-containing protein [unclassified Frankia]KPM56697.1 hypothetical protein ACG83_02090 [Frankia sp. R43]ONH57026.1 hypothetical protein CcI49_26725 [Frankia sp. CcI49]